MGHVLFRQASANLDRAERWTLLAGQDGLPFAPVAGTGAAPR
jgi:hypothetical protein